MFWGLHYNLIYIYHIYDKLHETPCWVTTSLTLKPCSSTTSSPSPFTSFIYIYIYYFLPSTNWHLLPISTPQFTLSVSLSQHKGITLLFDISAYEMFSFYNILYPRSS